MPDYIETPEKFRTRLRVICSELPDAYELPGWAGFRWCVRKKTFVTVWTRALDGAAQTRLQFRSSEPEFGFLVAAGPPFERAGWGANVVNMYVDDKTDWDEVGELLTESYCVMAPKKLTALIAKVDAPD